MGLTEQQKEHNCKYFPTPLIAPESDKEIIDVVCRAIDSDMPYRIPQFFNAGRTKEELHEFYKEYKNEAAKIIISCDPEGKTGGITIVPRYLLAPPHNTDRIV